jgi:uroporphyrinogen decarboxylase
MNSRERVLAVLNREPVDRIPVDIWYTDEVFKVLGKKLRIKTHRGLYRKLGLDKMVWLGIPYKGNLAPKKSEEEFVTLWGGRLKSVKAGEETYLETAEMPLASCQTPEEIENYPWWPNPDLFDYREAAMAARRAAGDYATLGPWVSFFEIYCGMRGLEQALMDLLIKPELVRAGLDRIEAIQTEMMKRFFERTAKYVDCTFVSDDMGGQNGLMISLDTWDIFFKERLERWCRIIHDYGIKVFFHSDGAVEPLIGRLIDAGIDILNPIQHRCPGMDIVDLKEKYGDKIIFHGGIDTQRLLYLGTPEEVRRETRRCLEILGAGGKGYICCSCHNIQRGTPVENILAYIETVHNPS